MFIFVLIFNVIYVLIFGLIFILCYVNPNLRFDSGVVLRVIVRTLWWVRVYMLLHSCIFVLLQSYTFVFVHSCIIVYCHSWGALCHLLVRGGCKLSWLLWLSSLSCSLPLLLSGFMRDIILRGSTTLFALSLPTSRFPIFRLPDLLFPATHTTIISLLLRHLSHCGLMHGRWSTYDYDWNMIQITKICESKIHSKGHGKTRHPKVSISPIYDIIPRIRPNHTNPNYKRPHFLDFIQVKTNYTILKT